MTWVPSGVIPQKAAHSRIGVQVCLDWPNMLGAANVPELCRTLAIKVFVIVPRSWSGWQGIWLIKFRLVKVRLIETYLLTYMSTSGTGTKYWRMAAFYEYRGTRELSCSLKAWKFHSRVVVPCKQNVAMQVTLDIKGSATLNGVACSASFLAEMSVRSPRKLFIFFI